MRNAEAIISTRWKPAAGLGFYRDPRHETKPKAAGSRCAAKTGHVHSLSARSALALLEIAANMEIEQSDDRSESAA